MGFQESMELGEVWFQKGKKIYVHVPRRGNGEKEITLQVYLTICFSLLENFILLKDLIK
jgi:hypothetical protein